MLPPWVISQKEAERQRREDQASHDRQPRLEAPRPMPHECEPAPSVPEERGSWDVDFTV